MITLLLRGEPHLLPAPLTVEEALHLLGLTSETHLAIRDGKLLKAEEPLQDGDVIQLIAAISGGNY